MTVGGKSATGDNCVDARNPADLETVVGGYPDGSAARAASAMQDVGVTASTATNWMSVSSVDTIAPADRLTDAGDDGPMGASA